VKGSLVSRRVINVTTERTICKNCTTAFNSLLPNLGKLATAINDVLASKPGEQGPAQPRGQVAPAVPFSGGARTETRKSADASAAPTRVGQMSPPLGGRTCTGVGGESCRRGAEP
jgi:hypothetical protein